MLLIYKEENGTSHQKQRFGWLIIEMLISNLLFNLLISFINTEKIFLLYLSTLSFEKQLKIKVKTSSNSLAEQQISEPRIAAYGEHKFSLF